MARFVKTVILLIALVALGLTVYDYGKGFYDEFMDEYKGNYSYQGENVVVEIPEGASAKEIASILKDKGLIKYKLAFTRRLSDSEYKGRLQPGTYTLNTGMSTLQMMAVMSPEVEPSAEPIDQLVIPEGFTIELIAARCENQGICTAEEFLNAVNSVTPSKFPYLNDVPEGAAVTYRLQGYIFPATYDIYEDTTAESLVAWMLETFDAYWDEDRQAKAEALGMNSFEVVTRASIVEREARVSEERPVIAGVIQNRIDDGMMLQMCPTVLYPLTGGMYDKPQVLYTDLEIDSPYNTYKHEGLPVGPICSPGLASIDAVLSPADTDYLYYHVIDEETGKHIFTETYEEHVNTQIIGGPEGIPEDAVDEDGDGIIDYHPDDASSDDETDEE